METSRLSRICLLNRIKAVGAMLTLCLAFASRTTSQAEVHGKFEGWCTTLEGASSADLVQFLNMVVPDQENARCVTWAIHRLGKEQYEPAVAALVRLLDFRRPQTEVDRAFHNLSNEMFPAEEALELLGKKALPELLRAIEADTTSATAREKAVKVWMEIYRYDDEDPKGIADLKHEESKAKSDTIKERLSWATGKALTHCNVAERADCQRAAWGETPDELR